MNLDNLQFNEYQTKLTEDLLNELPKEVKEQLLELINTVPYIQRLISSDRKRAVDLPKDKDGKIISTNIIVKGRLNHEKDINCWRRRGWGYCSCTAATFE